MDASNPPQPAVPGQTPEATRHPVVFFDGVCGLCNHSVNWLLARDRRRILRFAPLQGSTSRQYVPESARAGLKSMVLLDDGRIYLRSAAIHRILRRLGGFPAVLGCLLWLIPWPVRDLGYRAVSAMRYRLFGRHDTCRLPTPEERAVFLD